VGKAFHIKHVEKQLTQALFSLYINDCDIEFNKVKIFRFKKKEEEEEV